MRLEMIPILAGLSIIYFASGWIHVYVGAPLMMIGVVLFYRSEMREFCRRLVK